MQEMGDGVVSSIFGSLLQTEDRRYDPIIVQSCKNKVEC